MLFVPLTNAVLVTITDMTGADTYMDAPDMSKYYLPVRADFHTNTVLIFSYR
jgi:hypothetical protein